MANPYQSELSITIDGQPHVAKLTLGALVRLETRLGDSTLVGLVERFETGAIASRDIFEVLFAGLTACGWVGDEDALMSADIEGGPIAAAKAAAQLVALAFAQPAEAHPA